LSASQVDLPETVSTALFLVETSTWRVAIAIINPGAIGRQFITTPTVTSLRQCHHRLVVRFDA